jgi:hypothetical protein
MEALQRTAARPEDAQRGLKLLHPLGKLGTVHRGHRDVRLKSSVAC